MFRRHTSAFGRIIHIYPLSEKTAAVNTAPNFMKVSFKLSKDSKETIKGNKIYGDVTAHRSQAAC